MYPRAGKVAREFVAWLLVPGEFTTAFNANGFIPISAFRTAEAEVQPSDTDDLFKIEDRSR